MVRRKKALEPVLLNGLSAEDLEGICGVLNGDDNEQPEVRPHLMRLVRLWQASGPNLHKMLQADIGLESEIRASWKMIWLPSRSGNAQLALLPVGQKGAPKPEYAATVLFYLLTLNPEWERLAGPCQRCGRYYVMKTARQNKYCARRCGSLASATAANRRRLDQEHAEKLQRARTAMMLWRTKRANLDWKLWVSRKEPGITPKWLTRAVNKGELQTPQGRHEARR